jgi:hypothetical protein
MNYFLLLVILIIIMVILIITIKNNKCDLKEKWENYMRSPFNYLSTGATPMDFYRKDLYRKPFDYPYKFFKSYPVPCMQYHTLL